MGTPGRHRPFKSLALRAGELILPWTQLWVVAFSQKGPQILPWLLFLDVDTEGWSPVMEMVPLPFQGIGGTPPVLSLIHI